MSRSIQQSVQVSFRYPVVFTRDLFAVGNPVFADVLEASGGPAKVLFVVDDGVTGSHPGLLGEVRRFAEVHSERFTLVGEPLVLPGGEAVKQDAAHVRAVHDAIDRFGVDRHSYVVAVGGGALIDAVGFAAATAHRGVRLIRVPTTVLSQNDSAVGVKNSVNAYGKKNFLGTFAPPFAVLNDLNFLATLDDRDWRGGLSEAVKVALLKDPEFFVFLEGQADALRARDLDAMEHAVYRCAELHLQHIATSGDAFEQGSSRPLDFGHWAAHKLESMTGYALRHGEAVGIGIALDSTYSFLAGMLPREEWERVLGVFERLGLPVFTPELTRDLDAGGGVLAGLEEFREHLGGRLTIMLLQGVGRGVEVHEMDAELVRGAVRVLEERYGKERDGHESDLSAESAGTSR